MKALIFTDSTTDIGPSNNNFYYKDVLDLFTPLYPTTEHNVYVPLHYPTLFGDVVRTVKDILAWHFVEGATTVFHYDKDYTSHADLVDVADFARDLFGYSLYQVGGEPILGYNNDPAFTLVDKDHLEQRLNDDLIVTIPDDQRVIVVGDIHDNTHLIDELVKEHDTPDTLWVLCGDYIDGFGDVKKSLSYIANLDPDKFILIEGNHEHNMRWLRAGFDPAPDMTITPTNFDEVNEKPSFADKWKKLPSPRHHLEIVLNRVYPYVRLQRGYDTYTICHGGVSESVDVSDETRCWIADRTFIHGTSLPYMEKNGLHTYTVEDANLHSHQIIGHRNNQNYNGFLPIGYENNIYLLEQGIMHNRGLGYVICEPGMSPEGHILDIRDNNFGSLDFRNKH